MLNKGKKLNIDAPPKMMCLVLVKHISGKELKSTWRRPNFLAKLDPIYLLQWCAEKFTSE